MARLYYLVIVLLCFSSLTKAQQSIDIYYAGLADKSKTISQLSSWNIYSLTETPFETNLKIWLNDSVIFKDTREFKGQKGLTSISINDSALIWTGDSIIPEGRYEIKLSLKTDSFKFERGKTVKIKNAFPIKSLWVEMAKPLHRLSSPQLLVKRVDTQVSQQFIWTSIGSDINQRIFISKNPQALRLTRKGQYQISVFSNGLLLTDTVLNQKDLAQRVIHQRRGLIDFNDQIAAFNPKGALENRLSQKPIQFSGHVQYDFQYSNIDTLYSNLPNNYHRFFVRPHLNVYGIPLMSEFYYTTESGLGYNLNSFSLGFDRHSWEAEYRKKWSDEKARLGNKTSVLENSLKDMDDELDHLKSESKRLDGLQHGLDSATQQRLEKERIVLTNRIQDSFSHVENNLRDSLVELSDSLRPQPDSAQQAQLERIAEYRSQLAQKHSQITLQKNKVESQLAEIEERKQTIDEKFQQTKSLTEDIERNVNDAVLSKLKGFDIGLHTPYYGESILNGTPISGVSAKVEHKGVYTEFTHGKYTDSLTFFGMNTPSEFDKTFDGLRLGVRLKNHAFVDLNAFRFKEPNRSSDLILGVRTGINQGRLTLDAEAYSFTSAKNAMHISSKNGQMTLRGNYVNEKHKWTLSGQFDHSGENFRSPAVPFYRSNLRKSEIKISKSFLKSAINASAFLKKEAPIVSYNLPYKATGFGAEVNAVIPNGPMLGASYMPFQQSVALVRQEAMQQSQFSVFNAFISHQFLLWQSRHQSTGTYTEMGYTVNNETPKVLRQYSVQHSIRFPYPLTVNANLAFIDNRNETDTEGEYMTTGSLNVAYQFKKTETSIVYRNSINYLDDTEFQGVGLSIGYTPNPYLDIKASYNHNELINFLQVGNRLENRFNLGVGIAF